MRFEVNVMVDDEETVHEFGTLEAAYKFAVGVDREDGAEVQINDLEKSLTLTLEG
jgi:hypothetical protein